MSGSREGGQKEEGPGEEGGWGTELCPLGEGRGGDEKEQQPGV